jgi:hypothetical protein
MKKQINKRVSGLKQLTDGLSIKVQGIGPIVESKFIKCKEFEKNIAIQIRKS